MLPTRQSISLPLTLCAEARSQDDRDALWAATVITLRRFRDIPRVMKASAAVETRLKQETGALGYSLRVEILRRRFWTITIWTDEAALDRFLASAAHRAAEPLADELGALAPPRASTRWRAAASSPIDWNAAQRRLAQSAATTSDPR
jgi:quinol monooxygenase YgiN